MLCGVLNCNNPKLLVRYIHMHDELCSKTNYPQPQSIIQTLLRVVY